MSIPQRFISFQKIHLCSRLSPSDYSSTHLKKISLTASTLLNSMRIWTSYLVSNFNNQKTIFVHTPQSTHFTYSVWYCERSQCTRRQFVNYSLLPSSVSSSPTTIKRKRAKSPPHTKPVPVWQTWKC